MPDPPPKEAHNRNIQKIEDFRNKVTKPVDVSSVYWIRADARTDCQLLTVVQMVRHKVNGDDKYYYVLTSGDLPMRYSHDGTIQYKWVGGQEIAINTHDNSTVKSLGHRSDAIYGPGFDREEWIERANGRSGRRSF